MTMKIHFICSLNPLIVKIRTANERVLTVNLEGFLFQTKV